MTATATTGNSEARTATGKAIEGKAAAIAVPLGLHAKMVAARKDVGAVTKRGENTKQGYKFVKATDVANEVRQALAVHGIDFDYSLESERTWESPTASGGKLFFCSLIVQATFTDTETQTAKMVRGIGWGADSLEKAPYKAMTGALKYILRMNFLIPDEEDPEKDNNLYEDAKPNPVPIIGRIAEVSVKEDAVWVRLNDDKRDFWCFATVEPNKSKLLESEGKKLELLVTEAGEKKGKDGKAQKYYLIHFMAEA